MRQKFFDYLYSCWVRRKVARSNQPHHHLLWLFTPCASAVSRLCWPVASAFSNSVPHIQSQVLTAFEPRDSTSSCMPHEMKASRASAKVISLMANNLGRLAVPHWPFIRPTIDPHGPPKHSAILLLSREMPNETKRFKNALQAAPSCRRRAIKATIWVRVIINKPKINLTKCYSDAMSTPSISWQGQRRFTVSPNEIGYK